MVKAVFREKKLLFILFVIALIIRLAFIITFGHSAKLESDEIGYDQIALNLLEGKGIVYGKHYSLFPPLYPVFLSIIYAVFGHSYRWVIIIQAVIGSLTCLVIYSLVKAMLKDKAWAFIAGLLSCFYLSLIVMPLLLITECLFTFLFSLAVLLLLKSETTKSLSNKIISAITLGLATLTRSIVTLFPAIIFLWLLLKYRSIKVVLSKYFIYFLFFVLTLTPWTIRNYIIHRSFVPVTIQSGAVFWGSHNPLAKGGYVSIWKERGFPKYTHLSEVESDRASFKQGLKFLQSQTLLQNTKLIFLKIWWLLFPLLPMVYYKYDLTYVLLLPFFGIGIWRMRKSNHLLLYVMANFLFMAMLFYGHPRFRAPASPFIIALGTVGLKYCYDRFKDKAFFSFAVSGWVLFNLTIFIADTIFDFKFL